MYVCACICIRIWVCICRCICKCVCRYVFVKEYESVRVHIFKCISRCVCTCNCITTHVCVAKLYTYVTSDVHSYVYVHASALVSVYECEWVVCRKCSIIWNGMLTCKTKKVYVQVYVCVCGNVYDEKLWVHVYANVLVYVCLYEFVFSCVVVHVCVHAYECRCRCVCKRKWSCMSCIQMILHVYMPGWL